MRFSFALLAALCACSTPSVPPMTPAEMAAWERAKAEAAAQEAALAAMTPEQRKAAVEAINQELRARSARAAQAEAYCRYQGQLAAANASASFVGSMFAEARAQRACLDYINATGQLPH